MILIYIHIFEVANIVAFVGERVCLCVHLFVSLSIRITQKVMNRFCWSFWSLV